MVKLLTTERIWALAYLIVVAGLVFSFYVDAQQDKYQDAVDERVAAAEAKAAKAAAACIKRVIEVTNDSTVARADAAQRRDDALVGSKRALRELIRLRVVENVVGNTAEVRQAADQYLAQTEAFIQASKDLDKARIANPVPDPDEVC